LLILFLNCGLSESATDVAGSAILFDILSAESSGRTESGGCVIMISNDWGNTFQKAYCIESDSINCRYRTIVDIPDSNELTRRIDDLAFIQTNFTSCSGGVSELSAIYGSLNPESSMLLVALNEDADISDTNTVQMKSSKDCGQSNTIDTNQLRSIQGVEFDIALRASTTDACLDALNIAGESRAIIDRIRAGQLYLAQSCSIDNQIRVTC
jgi:hypothetical protein